MRRGLDFLAEIELGRAPPLDYAVRNIQNSQFSTAVDADYANGKYKKLLKMSK